MSFTAVYDAVSSSTCRRLLSELARSYELAVKNATWKTRNTTNLSKLFLRRRDIAPFVLDCAHFQLDLRADLRQVPAELAHILLELFEFPALLRLLVPLRVHLIHLLLGVLMLS